MNWLNPALVVLSISLLGYQAYSFAQIDEASIKASIRPPAQRTVIEFDEQNFQRLKKMKPEKSFALPNSRDFGKESLLEG